MEIKGKLKIVNGAAPGFQKLVIESDLLASNPNLVLSVEGDFEEEGEFVITLPEKKEAKPEKKEQKGKK